MENKKIVKWVLGIIFIIIFLITLFSSFKSIPTGFVGVKTQFGKVQNTMLNEGINFKIPYIEKIVLINCKTQKCEYVMEASSKDLQIVSNIKVAVNYNVNKNRANELYQNVGTQYESVLVEPAIYEAIKYGMSNYTAEELITMRGTVSDTILQILSGKLADRGIEVSAISLLDLSFSDQYDAAIERKQVVEQEVKAAQLELEKAKIENETKIENAKAEAEVMALQNKEITENTLKLKELEIKSKLCDKWDGKYPTTMLGTDTNALFNIGN